MISTQPCRTLPRPITPTSLLDSICWVVTETPTAAEVYTDSSGKVINQNGEAENGNEDENAEYGEPENKVSDKEFYTRVLSERYCNHAGLVGWKDVIRRLYMSLL